MDKLIITAALTGAITVPTQSKYLPYTPEAIASNAIADVLFGVVNPAGKLPQTFPQRLEDTPTYLDFPDENGKIFYGEGLFVGHRYYEKRKLAPLFPFGFGLSYTTLAIAHCNSARRRSARARQCRRQSLLPTPDSERAKRSCRYTSGMSSRAWDARRKSSRRSLKYNWSQASGSRSVRGPDWCIIAGYSRQSYVHPHWHRPLALLKRAFV